MTPQEQQLVADLFDRLASLEGQRRDPDAERLIREGLGRAPNSVYALVQSVLVQDEALKRANAHIEELERAIAEAGQAQGQAGQGGGFLDNMRNVIMGRDNHARGSVPSVRPGGQGSSGVWGARPEAAQGYPQQQGNVQPGYVQQGYAQQPGYAPMGGGMMGGGGGSFLGTAAATVAGVVGGAMLLNGIRNMMGGGHQAFGGDYPQPSHAVSPWDSGNAGNSNLARDAGVNDIGGGGNQASAYESGYDDGGRSNLLGSNDGGSVDQGGGDDSYDVGDSGDFDGGGGGDSDYA